MAHEGIEDSGADSAVVVGVLDHEPERAVEVAAAYYAGRLCRELAPGALESEYHGTPVWLEFECEKRDELSSAFPDQPAA